MKIAALLLTFLSVYCMLSGEAFRYVADRETKRTTSLLVQMNVDQLTNISLREI